MRPAGGNSAVAHEVYESPGNGYFAKFETMEDGVLAAVDLYIRKAGYAGRAPEDITRIWAGNPQSPGYWQAISACYESLL